MMPRGERRKMKKFIQYYGEDFVKKFEEKKKEAEINA